MKNNFMKWIKASERLPEKSGIDNKVIIRGTGFSKDAFGHEYKNSFVTEGFKNFNEIDYKFYFLIGNESFLTNENVEWLDESETHIPPEQLQQFNDWNEFDDYVLASKDDFTNYINSLKWDNELRTKVESLLICFDQMRNRLATPPLPSIAGAEDGDVWEEFWNDAKDTTTEDLKSKYIIIKNKNNE